MESKGGIISSGWSVRSDMHDVAAVMRRGGAFPSVTASAVAAGSLETTCRLKIESVERFSGDINKVRDELDEAGAGQEVFLVCQTEAEVRRLADIFAATRLAQRGPSAFSPGAAAKRISPGARTAWCCSAAANSFAAPICGGRPRRRLGRVIDSFLELHEGDLVVHVGHGIARYRGMKLLEKHGQVEEHLELEFQGRTKLYVPTSKIGLVQKYVGGTKSRPTLARLGGRTWERQKGKVAGGRQRHGRRHAGTCRPRGRRGRASVSTSIPSGSSEFDASFPYQETTTS